MPLSENTELAINELRKSMTNRKTFIDGELYVPLDWALNAFDHLHNEFKAQCSSTP